ncbi:U-box domain-containing protein 62 [Striga hermonthica]|uniref:U-box domain-containing protein 62 n=1 Tax=Striga hermonthica TaxID=68872 RepID=A0A9N7R4J6_STRHE|nr:U-box domain-containing protein 62 [Striga hermonthica]
MASEKAGMVSHQKIHNPQSQLVFSKAFACVSQPPHCHTGSSACDPVAKSVTRELTTSFLDRPHFFQSHSQPPPPQDSSSFRHQWHAGNASEDDELGGNDGDDEDEGEEGEVGNDLGNIADGAKISDGHGKERHSGQLKLISSLGFKDGNMTHSGNESNSGNNESGEARKTSSGELYYSQYLNNGVEGPSSSSGQKGVAMMENDCGYIGSKESSYNSEWGAESLRAIFSDPITGILMEDAMILPCGHSYGTSGIQQIIGMKACYLCSQSVSEDSIAPNLSLRIAVQAFKREEELQPNHNSKKRRDRYDHGTFADPTLTDQARGKGVQFPFMVTDHVIIKGNKRTPPRFVGREAIVTTQCLNGWYVVKTLDNAESVKLQYRSLEKVPQNPSASKPSPVKTTPNWL